MNIVPIPQYMQDVQLVDQVLEGQKDLYASLIQPYVNRLLNLAYARFRNKSDAEDLVQEVILKAFTKLDQYRGEARFGSWLTQIAINEVRQWQRKRGCSRLLLMESSVLDQMAKDDPGASPFEHCERNEMAKLLKCALAKLPDQYKVVIRLRDLQDRSITDTAELLHLSIGGVKTRHRRARIKMRCLLARMQRTSKPSRVPMIPTTVVNL